MDFCGFLRGFVGLIVGNCVEKMWEFCKSNSKFVEGYWGFMGNVWFSYIYRQIII